MAATESGSSVPRPLTARSLTARLLTSRRLSLALALIAGVAGLLLARLPLTGLLLVLGGAAIGIGTFVEPLVGVAATLLFGPLRAWLEIRSPGVVPHVGQAMLLFTLAVWAARGLAARNLRVRVPVSVSLLLVFLLVAALSLWDPVGLWDGVLEFLKWAQVVLLALVVYDRVAATPDRSRLAVAGLAGAALSQALVGLWQFALQGDGVEQFAIPALGEGFFRAYGTFQQPNPFGGFLGLVGALLVGLTAAVLLDRWQSDGPLPAVRAAAWPGVAALLVVAGLGASWSRGAWMGFGAALVVMVVLLPRRSWWGLALVAAVAAAGGGLALTGRLPAPVVERLTGFLAYTRFEDVRGLSISDASFAVIERMAHWQAALGMWRDHFWLGVGLGGYEAAYPAYRLINWVLPLGHAHNTYLNLLAEVGLVGLLAYLVWLGAVGLGLLRVLSHRLGWQRGLALGLLGAWTHLAVHSLVDSLWVNNVHLHIGVLLALSAWVVQDGQAPRLDLDRPVDTQQPSHTHDHWRLP